MKHFDVVVVGGGSAGVSAAITAARAGCATLLMERSARLGGNVVNALVHSICGLYRISSGGDAVAAQGGFAMEFARRLEQLGGAKGPLRMGRLDVVLQEPAQFSELCAQLVSDEVNLTVRCHAEVKLASVSGGLVKSVSMGSSGEEIEGKVFIDASGDGVLAALAGEEVERHGEAGTLQRPAYIFGMRGVDPTVMEPETRLRLAGVLTRAVRSGTVSPAFLGVAVRPTCERDQIRVTMDLAAAGDAYEPMDEKKGALLFQEAELLALQVADFFKNHIPGFEKSEVWELPQRLGIRESVRVLGRYQMTAHDILRGAVFEDAVAVSAWPVELRESAEGPRLRYPDGDTVCQIPLRALMARKNGNLLVVGRCLSATHEAQAALRVIGTCLGMGEAAGYAAALMSKDPERIRTDKELCEIAESIWKRALPEIRKD